MPAVSLSPADLVPFATIDSVKAQAMIDDALAQAWLVAPCITDSGFDAQKAKAAKAILRGAILRWNEAGTGSVTQQVAGPFQQTMSTTPRRSLFWPSEIDALEKLCRADGGGGAWGYDMLGCNVPQHADVCALHFGADYCSCGAVLCGAPMWETNGE